MFVRDGQRRYWHILSRLKITRKATFHSGMPPLRQRSSNGWERMSGNHFCERLKRISAQGGAKRERLDVLRNGRFDCGHLRRAGRARHYDYQNPRKGEAVNYRPDTQTGMMRQGTCKAGNGEVRMGAQTRLTFCCKPFLGPPSRKFCDQHSKTVAYRGKG
jgi:hypothetical protein